jgi:hypothetical protein
VVGKPWTPKRHMELKEEQAKLDAVFGLSNCPVCGKRIKDYDYPDGCEAPDGQRWCVKHLTVGPPKEVPFDLREEWKQWREGIKPIVRGGMTDTGDARYLGVRPVDWD